MWKNDLHSEGQKLKEMVMCVFCYLTNQLAEKCGKASYSLKRRTI